MIPGPAIDDKVAAVEASGAVSYFHTDRLGSVVAVSNGAGAASETYAFSPYGESANPVTGNPWRYTGRYLDAETGLYYYRARYYSPRLGQFLQTDPIGSKDDPNLYMYVGLDPGNATDPSGRFAWLIPAAQQCAANPVCRFLVSAAVREATRIILGPRPSGEIGPNIFVPAPQLPSVVTNDQVQSPDQPSGLGDLTNGEVDQIQGVVDEAGRPLAVVGSAARGTRQEGSDIDYVVGPSSADHFKGKEGELPGIDPKHGIVPGVPNPHQGPAIQFEPGARPRVIPTPPPPPPRTPRPK